MINSGDMQRFVPRLLFGGFICLWLPCLWGAVPVVNPGGVVNGASFTSPVVAGSTVSVLGSDLATTTATNANAVPWPTTLGGTSVQMNGTAAPLNYVSPTHIDLQVPWGLAGLTSASITVTTSGGTSSPLVFALAAFAPAIFTVDGLGTGQGAIYETPSYSLNGVSQPANPGQSIMILATGLGAVTNQPADGVPGSASPLSVTTSPATLTIGGLSATVTSSILAPGFVGYYQVYAQVPANASTGNAVPVVVTIGGAPSNTVTMVIQLKKRRGQLTSD